jgi:hypothetical protein
MEIVYQCVCLIYISQNMLLWNNGVLVFFLTCRFCQQTQTLNLLVVVQGQLTMCCTADESGTEGGFSAP